MEDSDLSVFPKELAAIQHARASDSRKHLIIQHSASFMWIIASLLALNSGGLFLLKDVEPDSGAWVVAGVSFYLGISFALAIGWISQRAIREGLVQISKAESFWATVIATGQYSSEEHSLLANEGQNGSSRPGGWFALLSFAAFSVGFFTLGCHAKTNTNTHENANAVHCPKPACRPSKVGG